MLRLYILLFLTLFMITNSNASPLFSSYDDDTAIGFKLKLIKAKRSAKKILLIMRDPWLGSQTSSDVSNEINNSLDRIIKIARFLDIKAAPDEKSKSCICWDTNDELMYTEKNCKNKSESEIKDEIIYLVLKRALSNQKHLDEAFLAYIEGYQENKYQLPPDYIIHRYKGTYKRRDYYFSINSDLTMELESGRWWNESKNFTDNLIWDSSNQKYEVKANSKTHWTRPYTPVSYDIKVKKVGSTAVIYPANVKYGRTRNIPAGTSYRRLKFEPVGRSFNKVKVTFYDPEGGEDREPNPIEVTFEVEDLSEADWLAYQQAKIDAAEKEQRSKELVASLNEKVIDLNYIKDLVIQGVSESATKKLIQKSVDILDLNLIALVVDDLKLDIAPYVDSSNIISATILKQKPEALKYFLKLDSVKNALHKTIHYSANGRTAYYSPLSLIAKLNVEARKPGTKVVTEYMKLAQILISAGAKASYPDNHPITNLTASPFIVISKSLNPDVKLFNELLTAVQDSEHLNKQASPYSKNIVMDVITAHALRFESDCKPSADNIADTKIYEAKIAGWKKMRQSLYKIGVTKERHNWFYFDTFKCHFNPQFGVQIKYPRNRYYERDGKIIVTSRDGINLKN